jgi:hypothetical protein
MLLLEVNEASRYFRQCRIRPVRLTVASSGVVSMAVTASKGPTASVRKVYRASRFAAATATTRLASPVVAAQNRTCGGGAQGPRGLLQHTRPHRDPQQCLGLRAEQCEVELGGQAQRLALQEGFEPSAGRERGGAGAAG